MKKERNIVAEVLDEVKPTIRAVMDDMVKIFRPVVGQSQVDKDIQRLEKKVKGDIGGDITTH